MDVKYERLESKTTKKENPRKNASILSILSFWWAREILAIGNKRPIENDDLFPLLDEDKSLNSAEKLQRTWSEELYPVLEFERWQKDHLEWIRTACSSVFNILEAFLFLRVLHKGKGILIQSRSPITIQ